MTKRNRLADLEKQLESFDNQSKSDNNSTGLSGKGFFTIFIFLLSITIYIYKVVFHTFVSMYSMFATSYYFLFLGMTRRDQIKAEIDNIIASECLYCGENMIRNVDKPFIEDFEYESITREWQ